jgi:hypothetical protein
MIHDIPYYPSFRQLRQGQNNEVQQFSFWPQNSKFAVSETFKTARPKERRAAIPFKNGQP